MFTLLIILIIILVSFLILTAFWIILQKQALDNYHRVKRINDKLIVQYEEQITKYKSVIREYEKLNSRMENKLKCKHYKMDNAGGTTKVTRKGGT